MTQHDRRVVARKWLALPCLLLVGVGCSDSGGPSDAGAVDAGPACVEGESTCVGALYVSCDDGAPEVRSCADEGLVCAASIGCATCVPAPASCSGVDVVRCTDAGEWELEPCDTAAGLGCEAGQCVDLCELARERPGTRGCELFAVALDHAEVLLDPDPSFGVIVVNPWLAPVTVTVEQNDAGPGEPVALTEVTTATIPGGDTETIELPRRPVDRASSSAPETHSAVTSNAYRVRSTLPVTVYQMNPLYAEGYSADGSRLLPSAALGSTYTVSGWPQTIAHSDNPDHDFDGSREDEDLRAFLTIVGTTPGTHVAIQLGDLGPNDAAVVAGEGVPALGPGDTFEIDLGSFDVVNLETWGFNSDFTGTTVTSSHPVAVFVGSEASDVPSFEVVAERQCCGDHLEEQLLPDSRGGRSFVIGHPPSRSSALARASVDAPVAVYDEPAWVRIVAVTPTAEVRTTLAPPDDGPFELSRGESVTLRAERSFRVDVIDDDGLVRVLQALPSQQAIGLRADTVGGDPSIVDVCAVEHLTPVHAVATPPSYPFDFLTVIAPASAAVAIDGTPPANMLSPSGDAACDLEVVSSSTAGIEDWVVHRCQLSFPTVLGPPNIRFESGAQADGGHLVSADAPVAVVLSGFGYALGYAYPGELRLESRGEP